MTQKSKRPHNPGQDRRPLQKELSIQKVTHVDENFKDKEPLSPTADITIFTASKGRMAKTFGLDEAGTLVKKQPGKISKGRYQVFNASLAKLQEQFPRLATSKAACLGVPINRKSGRITWTADHDKKGKPADPIPRNKHYFKFHTGQPAFFLLDIDGVNLTVNEVLNIIAGLVSGFKQAGKLIVYSSSAGLYDKVGNILKDSTSAHVYLIVNDGEQIPKLMSLLFDRLWIAGYGHIQINKDGSMSKRAIIDNLVASPERIIYEAAPVLKDGITQDRPDSVLIDGKVLGVSNLQDLTATEAKELEEVREATKEMARPEEQKVKAAYQDREADKLVKTQKISKKQAIEVIESRQNLLLQDDDLLYFARNKGLPKSVSEVLNDGEKYHKQSCADPIEHDYDGGSLSKAKFYWNDGWPLITSYAHGRKTYRFATIEGKEKENSEAQSQEWEDPLPIKDELPPVFSMTAEMIPEPFRAWVTDASERMQVPPDFFIVPLLVVCSSIIGTSCRIKPKQNDDWSVVPNLWGGIVGPPSMMKTPSLNEAVNKTLGRLETAARLEHEEATNDHEIVAMATAAEIKALKAAIEKSARLERDKKNNGKSPSELAEEMRDLQAREVPTERRYKTNDSSIEKIVELLQENPRGLLYFRDEIIGLFKRMERAGNEQDRAFMLEAWNGDGSHVDPAT